MMKSIEIEALSLVIAVWWGISKELLAKVHPGGAVKSRVYADETGTAGAHRPAKAEQHDSLVLAHDPYRDPCERKSTNRATSPITIPTIISGLLRWSNLTRVPSRR